MFTSSCYCDSATLVKNTKYVQHFNIDTLSIYIYGAHWIGFVMPASAHAFLQVGDVQYVPKNTLAEKVSSFAMQACKIFCYAKPLCIG